MRASGECGTEVSRTPALPYDGGRNWLAVVAIPDDRRLTLVSNSKSGDLTGRIFPQRQYFTRGTPLRLPDLFRVLLDPTRVGVRGAHRYRLHREAPALLIVERRPRTGSSFVQGKKIGHQQIKSD